jgi:hypothetical protein
MLAPTIVRTFDEYGSTLITDKNFKMIANLGRIAKHHSELIGRAQEYFKDC